MLTQLENSSAVYRLEKEAVCPYSSSKHRLQALRKLALLGALSGHVLVVARNVELHEYLRCQARHLAQKAHEVSAEWMHLPRDERAIPLETWLEGRRLAGIEVDGIVEGTSLHYKLAQRLTYCNIAFMFRLERRGGSMVMVHVKRHPTARR